MPTFHYRAVELANQAPVEGLLEAADERAARVSLRTRGLLPLAVEVTRSEGARANPALQALVDALTFYPVKSKDLAVFTQQLAALVEAGIPLIEAMLLLDGQVSNPSIRKALDLIRKDLLGGSSLSDAMSRHPRIFSPLFISLVNAGELSGSLDIMLVRLAGMIEASAELERKVKSALTYPALLAVTLTMVVAVILVFVVPSFQGIYTKAGSALPLPTQILLTVSGFLQTSGAWLLLLGVVAWVAYRWFRATPVGKPLVDQAWLRVPLLGRLLLEQQANTFTRAFGTVYGAGVPIIPALENCRRVIGNEAIARQIDRATDGVRQGRPLSSGLENSPYFPRILAQMMAIGESSGRLEELCAKAVGFSDKDLDYRIKQLTTMLEPALTVVMGLIVAVIALALYLPMFDLPTLLIKR